MDPWVMEDLREGYHIPFLRPPLFAEPIRMPSYAPTSIKGAALEEVILALIAKGAVELAPLLSPGFYSRLFVVWKTSGSWRPVIDLSLPQSLCGRVALLRGDRPVCSSVCPAGRLDGLHRPSGGVSPGSCSSGISSLPTLCGLWPRLPVHSSVLRSVHGPTGLHSGYGSCVSYTSFLGYPYASLPRRLACPGLLPGGSLGSGVVLSLCRELGIVVNPEKSNFSSFQVVQYLGVIIDARTFMAFRCQISSPGCCQPLANFCAPPCLLPACGSRCWGCCPLCLIWFQVATCGRERSRSAFTTLGISWILQLLCRGLRTVFGTFGGGFTGIASLAGCLSVRFPRIWTSVRCFRRRLGGSLGGQGCFRPLGPVGGSSSRQCQGVPGSALWSPPLPVLSVRDHGGGVFRQRHRGSLSAQGGGHPVSCSQHHCAGDPPLGGISSDSAGSPVYSGDPQCSRQGWGQFIFINSIQFRFDVKCELVNSNSIQFI